MDLGYPGLPSPNIIPASDGTIRHQFDEMMQRAIGGPLTEHFRSSLQYRDMFRAFVAGYVIALTALHEMNEWPDQAAAQEHYRRRCKEIEGFGVRLGEST